MGSLQETTYSRAHVQALSYMGFSLYWEGGLVRDGHGMWKSVPFLGFEKGIPPSHFHEGFLQCDSSACLVNCRVSGVPQPIRGLPTIVMPDSSTTISAGSEEKRTINFWDPDSLFTISPMAQERDGAKNPRMGRHTSDAVRIYAGRPLVEELIETVTEAFLANLEFLSSNRLTRMERFIDYITEKRLVAGFPLSHVQKAFELFRSIVTRRLPG